LKLEAGVSIGWRVNIDPVPAIFAAMRICLTLEIIWIAGFVPYRVVGMLIVLIMLRRPGRVRAGLMKSSASLVGC
jgi:hypothetical protein